MKRPYLIVFPILLMCWMHSAQSQGCNGRPGLQISLQDDYVFLNGNICSGDGNKFVQFMNTTGIRYKLVRLNLTGGSGKDAVQIGRYLRKHELTTWTDGRKDICASACNRIFAGGSHRIYSHANYIKTGKDSNQKLGLGYHHPNQAGNFSAAEDWYQTGIVPFLKEMLPTKAFDWIYQTDESNLTPNMIWLNGKQALELGIATSQKSPRD